MEDEAVEQALRALRHRDRSSSQIERYLEARGVDEQERAQALPRLTRTGLVDDRRFADERARSLAERGAGDALIEHDLDAAGVARREIEEALRGLEDEASRAREIVERRGAEPRTERYLLAKGFSPDVAHGAIAAARSESLR